MHFPPTGLTRSRTLGDARSSPPPGVVMNPGVGGRLATTRVQEWRGAAASGGTTTAAASGGAKRIAARRRHAVLRPVGHVLIRLGRRLAGPEPERPVVALRRPGWSR